MFFLSLIRGVGVDGTGQNCTLFPGFLFFVFLCYLRFPPIVLHARQNDSLQPQSPKQETGRILFREYCFGEENSLSLTEFYGKLGEFGERLGEFAFAQIIGWEELTEFAPRNSVSPENSLSSVFETVLPETVFGPFLTKDSNFIVACPWLLRYGLSRPLRQVGNMKRSALSFSARIVFSPQIRFARLGVLSHHLKCEMKSPIQWILAKILSIFSRNWLKCWPLFSSF